MAHPKSRISKSRRDKRRTHYKASLPTLATCSNCGATVRYHTICPDCGYYRGKQVIEKEIAV
ncbi:MAG: 50S ribosomal protein L32 [Bacteroidota bacterium]